MRVEEAQRIAFLVTELGLGKGAVCLNIGSSTKYFREVAQPHINRELIQPLVSGGLQFIHCDIKPDEGVDLIGDVLDPIFQKEMLDRRADILFCCNLLEHLTNPQAFANACANLVRPGGFMVISVPLSYPYHTDPIDTMLRPTPNEIGTLFPKWEMVKGEVVTSQTYLEELRNQRGGMTVLVRHIAAVLMPFYRPVNWWGKAHRLLWLFRPYKVSVAIFRKP